MGSIFRSDDFAFLDKSIERQQIASMQAEWKRALIHGAEYYMQALKELPSIFADDPINRRFKIPFTTRDMIRVKDEVKSRLFSPQYKEASLISHYYYHTDGIIEKQQVKQQFTKISYGKYSSPNSTMISYDQMYTDIMEHIRATDIHINKRFGDSYGFVAYPETEFYEFYKIVCYYEGLSEMGSGIFASVRKAYDDIEAAVRNDIKHRLE